ncbi:methyltransferase domain-containing protein [Vibrio splendidus]|uniref:Methyltransferase type 11 domain-containing protein n=1 Tax=Vibrio splendidus TaxID=29497 RepID=A0A2N7JJ50_VIBSP|nr:methyltransferase domain-containing protein [Vibrio splendidus]PMM40246.1 hypothetical protein BCT54_12755 [Vibrio splendidus]
MAHPQQIKYCQSIKEKFPSYFKDKFVLDIGSLDINGANRDLFESCKYIGVDIGIGKNVDIVSKGHELTLPNETFDTIISTECFEHDMYYQETILNIIRMLKPGGLFLFTCATEGRPEHGTSRTSSEADAPFLQQHGEWSDYYKNLTEKDVREFIDVEQEFSDYHFDVNEESYDLYFFGIKKGEFLPHDGYSHLIKKRKSSQIYLKVNGHYSEENSIKLPFNPEGIYEFDLRDYKELDFTEVRFDPINNVSNIVIESIVVDHKRHLQIEGSNANEFKNNIYRFHHDDPSIYMKIESKPNVLSINVDYVDFYES